MRDIKRRIASVQNIQQITKAMELVSATKLRRAQQSVATALPYAAKLEDVLSRLLAATTGRGAKSAPHPLLAGREVKRVCYVLITADRGLAGAYNANIIRLAEQVLEADTRETAVIALGRRGRDHWTRRGRPLHAEYTQFGDDIDFHMARDISRTLTDLYVSGTFDEVNLIYTRFISTGSQRPDVVRLLPLAGLAAAPEAGTGDGRQSGAAEEPGPEPATPIEYIYEPSAQEVLNLLLPRHVDMQVFRALLEAKASEHASRMRAMRAATDNATEMIRTLTLSFNRARQAAITKEIAEIVGGAEALNAGAGS
ncbi:MAG: ATP synthase F1 subunit gamma [Firmicutes bacterium]|nr:ATP synthase F1 subunit gamma [Bacillota bacterium]